MNKFLTKLLKMLSDSILIEQENEKLKEKKTWQHTNQQLNDIVKA